MAKRRFDADVPDGTHLGVSRDDDGTLRGTLFDDETGRLVGHIKLEEVDDEDEDSGDYYIVPEEDEGLTGKQLLGVVAFLGVAIGAAKGVQYARNRREQNRLRSSVSTPSYANVQSRRQLPPPSPEQRVPPLAQPSPVPAVQVAVTRDEHTVDMSRAEWEERVRAMLLARAFSEEQQRILSHARITDADPEMLEWQRAFDSLTPQQFSDRITLMLEANPALLTEAEARFLALFGPGRAPERERVPVEAASEQARVTAVASVPAGWYDDGRGGKRWWNGQAWTEHSQPAQSVTAATPSTSPPGWYADGYGWLRWWDGRQWTPHVSPAPGHHRR